MKTLTRLFGALSIMLLFFLTSCASTKVTGEWKDPDFSSQKFKKILVLGVAKQPAQRKLYEDEFVQQLEAKGTKAIASHTLIPHDEMREKEKIVQNIEGQGIDGVIITRLRNLKEKAPIGRQRNMHVYYSDIFSYVSIYDTPGTSGQTYQQKYSLESKLYDAKTEKPVFSLFSDTVAQDDVAKRLDSYIKTVVNKLVENNLI